jgi:hypothetical protein
LHTIFGSGDITVGPWPLLRGDCGETADLCSDRGIPPNTPVDRVNCAIHSVDRMIDMICLVRVTIDWARA